MISGGLISLTFDDALDQHIDAALPVLLDKGLRGTFYAHLSASSLSRRTDDWRRLAAVGNELGNHTIFHPADARKAWVSEGNALDLYTLDRMRMELKTASDFLSILDGHTERTFAYPCSNSILGAWGKTARLLFRLGLRNTRWPGLAEKFGLDLGNTRQSYQPIAAELFVAARGGGLQLSDAAPAISDFRRERLLSAAVQGESFQDIRAFVERSLANSGWAILQLHGVGGGHWMDCDLSVFRDVIHWIADHHHNQVVTVLEGARRGGRKARWQTIQPRRRVARLRTTPSRRGLHCGRPVAP